MGIEYVNGSVIVTGNYKSTQISYIDKNTISSNDFNDNDNGRAIFINGAYNTITDINSNTASLLNDVPESVQDSYIDIAYTFSDFPDDAVIIEPQSTGYVVKKNLYVDGFFHYKSGKVIFQNCKFFVRDGGVLFFGDYKLNSEQEPIAISTTSIDLSGNSAASYGRDNYKYTDRSPVQDGGTLIMSGVSIRLLSTSRCDFDFRLNSIVYLYNTTIYGTSDAYHHFNSTSMTIINVNMVSAYSVEMLQRPLLIKNFKSTDCHYGLSFFPPHTDIGDPVYVYNLEVINANEDIKRNSRSSLALVNTELDFDNLKTSGSVPITMNFETYDRVIDDTGNIRSNVPVYYYFPEIPINYITDDRVNIGFNALFTHAFVGDEIILYSDDVESGETFNITNFSANEIYLNRFTSDDTYEFARIVHKKISNSDGNVPKLALPYGYIGKASNEFKRYGNILVIAEELNKRSEFNFVAMNNLRNIITLVDESVTQTTDNDAINELRTDISALSGAISNLDFVDSTTFSGLQTAVDSLAASIATIACDCNIDEISAKIDSLITSVASIDTNVDPTTFDSSFNDIKNDIADLATSIGSLNSNNSTIVTEVSDIKTIVDGTNSAISNLQTSLDAVSASVNGFTCDCDLTDIRTKLDEISTAVGSINVTADTTGINTELETIKSDIAALSTSVASIDCNCDNSAVITEVSGLRTIVDGTNLSVTDISTAVNGLITDVSNMSTTLQSDVSDLKSSLTTLSASVGTISCDCNTDTIVAAINALQTVVDTNSTDVDGLQADINSLITAVGSISCNCNLSTTNSAITALTTAIQELNHTELINNIYDSLSEIKTTVDNSTCDCDPTSLKAHMDTVGTNIISTLDNSIGTVDSNVTDFKDIVQTSLNTINSDLQNIKVSTSINGVIHNTTTNIENNIRNIEQNVQDINTLLTTNITPSPTQQNFTDSGILSDLVLKVQEISNKLDDIQLHVSEINTIKNSVDEVMGNVIETVENTIINTNSNQQSQNNIDVLKRSILLL